MVTTIQQKRKVSEEEYIQGCFAILANKKLKDLEKLVALMEYCEKIEILSQNDQLNEFLHSKKR